MSRAGAGLLERPIGRSLGNSARLVGPDSERVGLLAGLEGILQPLTVEREIRYFINLADLRTHVMLDPSQSVKIVQRYFPKDLLGLIKGFVAEMGQFHPLINGVVFSQARIRRAEGPDGVSYTLEAKGPFQTRVRGERREMPITISAELYKDLLPFASAGAYEKVRYPIEGRIISSDGAACKVQAEIDLPMGAGRDFRSIDKRQLNFAFVDVELPHKELVRPLRAGAHSFTFLQRAIDLSRADPETLAAVSTRRIAKRGFDQKAWAAIRRLQAIDC